MPIFCRTIRHNGAEQLHCTSAPPPKSVPRNCVKVYATSDDTTQWQSPGTLGRIALPAVDWDDLEELAGRYFRVHAPQVDVSVQENHTTIRTTRDSTNHLNPLFTMQLAPIIDRLARRAGGRAHRPLIIRISSGYREDAMSPAHATGWAVDIRATGFGRDEITLHDDWRLARDIFIRVAVEMETIIADAFPEMTPTMDARQTLIVDTLLDRLLARGLFGSALFVILADAQIAGVYKGKPQLIAPQTCLPRGKGDEAELDRRAVAAVITLLPHLKPFDGRRVVRQHTGPTQAHIHIAGDRLFGQGPIQLNH